jgi:hypothetical protein
MKVFDILTEDEFDEPKPLSVAKQKAYLENRANSIRAAYYNAVRAVDRFREEKEKEGITDWQIKKIVLGNDETPPGYLSIKDSRFVVPDDSYNRSWIPTYEKLIKKMRMYEEQLEKAIDASNDFKYAQRLKARESARLRASRGRFR